MWKERCNEQTDSNGNAKTTVKIIGCGLCGIKSQYKKKRHPFKTHLQYMSCLRLKVLNNNHSAVRARLSV